MWCRGAQAWSEKRYGRDLALVPHGYKKLTNSQLKKYLEPGKNGFRGNKENKEFCNGHHKFRHNMEMQTNEERAKVKKSVSKQRKKIPGET